MGHSQYVPGTARRHEESHGAPLRIWNSTRRRDESERPRTNRCGLKQHRAQWRAMQPHVRPSAWAFAHGQLDPKSEPRAQSWKLLSSYCPHTFIGSLLTIGLVKHKSATSLAINYFTSASHRGVICFICFPESRVETHETKIPSPGNQLNTNARYIGQPVGTGNRLQSPRE